MKRRPRKDAMPKLTGPQRRLLYLGRKGRYGAGVALVLLALFAADRLGLFGRPERLARGDAERYDGKSFLVVRVTDGDTLDVDVPDGKFSRTRIRLWGVDTPETKDPRKGVQHFGPQASAFTSAACEHATVTLKLAPGPTRDRYGRLLAYVILPDGNSLNAALIRDGYGYADPRYRHPLSREYRRLQDAAMRARRGLWKDVQPADLPYYYRDRLKLPLPRPPYRGAPSAAPPTSRSTS